MVALTVEAAAMAKVPLAGTNWIPGRSAYQSGTEERTACPPKLGEGGRSHVKNTRQGTNHGHRSAEGRERPQIKYFLINFVDLFGVLRAKLVPAAAIGEMQRDGAGFAGFATWLNILRPHPDIFARPDPDSLIQLPWKPEVAWLAADLWMDGKEVDGSPRAMLKHQIDKAAKQGYRMKSGVECEYFLFNADGKSLSDPSDTQEKPCYDQQALMRRYRCDHRDLRLHAAARLEALSERPRGRERSV